MSHDIIQADYEQLIDIANRFQNQAETQLDLKQKIDQQVAALQGKWQGKGSQAFFREMDYEVIPALQRLLTALEESAHLTHQIIETFQAAEEEAANQLNFGGGDTLVPPDRIIDFFLAGKTRIEGSYTVTDRPLFAAGSSDQDTISPNDVDQQGLGDCYLIAAMAAIADQNPELIRNSIRDNGDGTYTVTLYEKKGGFLGIGGNLEKVEVTVTPDFPNGQYYSKEAGQWVPLPMDVGSGDDELWPRLLEKAYGQHISGDSDVKGIYNKLDKGGFSSDALEALSGSKSVSSSPDHYSIQDLADMHKKGYALTLSSKIDYGPFTNDHYRDDSLVRGHAYWIDSVDVENQIVVVRNPWGYDGYRIEIPMSELDENFRQITVNSLGKD